MFGWDDEKQKEKPGTKRGPSGKNVVSPKTTPGLNAKTCGNIAAGITDAISFLLTRTPVLGLSDEEEKEIGESLYETVSNFPATSASVKFLNFVAPWAGLMHTSSKIIMKRLAFIEKHRVKPPVKQQPLFPEDGRGVIFAPNPAQV